MNFAVEIDQLTKRFAPPAGWRRMAQRPHTTAVNQVSLQVAPGELFGLLGPNGAGKTTLVKILCTLILPDSGWARVAGYALDQPRAIRAAVGLVVADERSFYWRLSGRRNLQFFAAMHNLYGAAAQQRIDQVLAAVDMLPQAETRFSSYSTGMKQRLAIARALLHQPRLLFLDEPSRSLDPAATRRLHTLVQRLAAEQSVTIFLITHDLAEAEALCQRVAVMHKGEVRAVGSPLELRRHLQPHLHYTLRLDALPAEMVPVLTSIVPDIQWDATGQHTFVRFRAGETDHTLTRVLDALRAGDRMIYSIEGQPPTLEEVFAHYTRETENRQQKTEDS